MTDVCRRARCIKHLPGIDRFDLRAIYLNKKFSGE